MTLRHLLAALVPLASLASPLTLSRDGLDVSLASPITPSYTVVDCIGYTVNSVQETDSGVQAQLQLAGTACNAFGVTIPNLTLSVTYETSSRLHVHIYDTAQQQYQLPQSVLLRPSTSSITASQSDFIFHYTNGSTPFAFWVEKRSTGAIVFDTRPANIPVYPEPLFAYENNASVTNTTAMPAHPLVFSNQYLQLSSALPENANIYGLGEYISGNFRRDPNSTVQPFFTLDIGDPLDSNLYGYHPIYVETRFDNAGNADSHGVFLLQTSGMDILLRPGVVQYRAIGGTFDFYFFSGDSASATGAGTTNSPLSVVEQYVQFVGLPQMPPLWGFGYHQCRWGYNNVSDTQFVIDSMRAANIPLETQWNDIDWMDAYRDFIPAPNRFAPSEYEAMVQDLHDNHQHYIPIIDGAIGVQIPNGTDVYDPWTSGTEQGIFIHNEDGSQYIGQVWPGYTSFPDWYNNQSQAWWSDAFRNFSQIISFDGIWEDMNEPSSFCVGSCGTGQNWSTLGAPDTSPTIVTGWPEGYDYTLYGTSGNMTVNGSSTYVPDSTTNFKRSVDVAPASRSLAKRDDILYQNVSQRFLETPPYAIHNAKGPLDVQTVAMNATTAFGAFYDVKNIWGHMSEVRTHTALLSLAPDNRPFLVARSTYAGSGKYTHHWLGDNYSTWRYMAYSIQGILQFQIFGIPMVGADTCGFNQNTDEELCNRWMMMSAFTPFFRNHNTRGALPQEPFRWDSVADASRRAAAARYSILPYFYTYMAQASITGTPAMRAVFWEFPSPDQMLNDRQFMVGPSLLVTPVLEPNVTSVKGTFPGDGPWRDLWTHAPLNVTPNVNTSIAAPLSQINVHIRPGSVILQYAEPAYTIYETQQSQYDIVVALDNNGTASGTAYIDDGESQWPTPSKTITFTAGQGQLTITPGSGAYHIPNTVGLVSILGVPNRPQTLVHGGSSNSTAFTYEPAIQRLNATLTDGDLNSVLTLSWA
ncbi:glycoside hydrolase family 31 protein [Calocera viscosa TUFC12733]|uniref:Glycoside hydrolase family 31 protein n=1 Tax=Calocera viscosa (strain TUFC12733) TaxID=1330018 RepID=A0A167GME5_CALVF|nr:glycoside hydrolase family 31 protein [Calocera viscosa TUFC12733]